MHKIAFIILLVLIFLPGGNGHAQISMDTIVVHADTACSDFMPHRITIVSPSSKLGDDTSYRYADSIRVCGEIVNAYHQSYYLVVYDQKGNKRLEGEFYDEHANGHCINYDWKGRKTDEGDYEMVQKGKKYRPSRKTGTWKFFNPRGDLIREEKQ